ncbi:hypothetical protein ACQP0C_13605 [Nocardia sp. CA-129566]|uniref:hypothetical protein n=1 Tax=Nocardia sp. CA-129566 TaxID=3239976 RepID=UPI003D978C5A
MRPLAGHGHVETRKTRALDGGVEWYELYDDGHQEGFQAKFNANLADALGGMRESVKAVATKRSQMTRLTFVVPYDFTDGASAKSKSDQDRWDDAVAGWKTDIVGADRLTLLESRGAAPQFPNSPLLHSLQYRHHCKRGPTTPTAVRTTDGKKY